MESKSSRKPPPLSHRVRVENAMIKKREKQSQYDQLWDGRKNYYEHWEKKNSKYEEWTSPRYHEEHSKLIEKFKRDREHEDKLEKRREKLRTLLNEEEKLYKIEAMIYKTKKDSLARSKADDIPVEVLKEVNDGLKIEEDDRRRHEAELNLYHQWRSTNPVLRHYERMHKGRELKLSWLDQQIENRMKKEKEEEECRRILKEREKIMREEELKEKQYQKELDLKKQALKTDLDKQVEELRKRNEVNEELKKKEAEEEINRLKLLELEELQVLNCKKKSELECALYNIKHYKLKLKKRAEIVEENLRKERDLIVTLRDLEISEKIEDEAKRAEINDAISQILILNKQQKDLEKCRLKHLDFLFDSEAKYQYEQQCHQWQQEESARTRLIKDVLETVRNQISQNIEKHREKQKEILKERDEVIRKIEDYNGEIMRLQREEEARRVEFARKLKDDVKIKQVRKKERENLELKKIDEELERARREEERLKQEIMNIQRKQGPIRPVRSKLFL